MRRVIFLAMAMMVLFAFVSCKGKQETIRLGATFPLTGAVASYGVSAKNGIQLKVDELNEADGINGKKVFIDFQDDKNSIRDAVNIFNNFVNINKYQIVFGSAGSSVSEALVPISLSEKVILISPISGSARLSSDKWEYFFRTIPSDEEQSARLAEWVISDGIKNVAVIYTNNSWGKPLAESFMRLFKESGGNVVFEEGTPEGISDFRTIILKLRQANFDAIISPTYPKEGGILVKQLKESGINARLYGGDNWGAPEFRNIAGNSAEGVFFTFPSESQSPQWDNFVEKYRIKYNEKPDIFAAYAYDAATAIFEAMKKSKQLSADEIRSQLLLLDFEGLTGRISFKENGDIDNEGYGKRTIENGKLVTINQKEK